MRRLLIGAVLALPAALPGCAPAQGAACPFLPQFGALTRAIAQAPPADALRRRHDYLADPANKNPAACEAFEIERLVAVRERVLVTLSMLALAPLAADAACHCTRFVSATTRCDGIAADGTGFTDGVLPRTGAVRGRVTARIANALAGARLIGVYRATPGDDFGRRPATRLAARGPVSFTATPGTVLIALFNAPAPFKVRKPVWYF